MEWFRVPPLGVRWRKFMRKTLIYILTKDYGFCIIYVSFKEIQIMKTANVHQRKIVLDKSIPNCYNMYMKKRWNVAKELERIAERKRKWKQIDWVFLLKHPLTWLLLMTLVAGLLRV